MSPEELAAAHELADLSRECWEAIGLQNTRALFKAASWVALQAHRGNLPAAKLLAGFLNISTQLKRQHEAGEARRQRAKNFQRKIQ